MATEQQATPREIRAEHFPDLDDEVMYPRLSEAKIEKFATLGTRRTFAPGETLYEQGQRDAPFLVIERGRVRVLDRKPGKVVWIAEADAGRSSATSRPSPASRRSPSASPTSRLT